MKKLNNKDLKIVRFIDQKAPEKFIDKGTQILKNCFSEDAGLLWLAQSKDILDQMIEPYYHSLLKDEKLAKDFCLLNEEVIGVSLTSPPHYEGNLQALMEEDLPFTLEQLKPIFERIIFFSEYVNKKRLEIISSPHWRYNFVGISPEYQGQGLGSEILQFTKSESLKKPEDKMYIETSQKINVPFYIRNGFSIVKEYDVPNNGPHFWCFLSNP